MQHLFEYETREQYLLALAAIKDIGVDYEADDEDLSIQTDELDFQEIELMMLAQDPIKFRVKQAHERLVDETENPATAGSEWKSTLLSRLLELFEWLRGNSEENPLPEWFE